jgi:ribokinase
MKTSPIICVVGSINMDLVFRTPRMPAAGETISGHEFVQIAGGKGANQAVAAARQGAQTTLIACVGDDAYGVQSISGLKQDGINTDAISTIANCATGVAGIFVDDQGRNSIVIAPGANARLTPAHISTETIQAAQLLICQCETPLATIAAAMQIAHRHGVKVLFNPAPAIPLPDTLFALVDYLIVNETEAGQLSGVPVTDIDSARLASQQLLNRGVHCVLLTLGEQGVCVSTHQQFDHIHAINVTAVDTTAAGDTFVGAFATAIGYGMNELEAAKEAQYSAALTVTKLGAQSSIPHRADVEHFKATLN